MNLNNTALLRSMRVPFLALTFSCVFLGYSTALVQSGGWASDQIGGQISGISNAVSISHVILVLLGALCAHLSVNLLNEYQDFQSGLDALTKKTPFSGGSGALVDHPEYSIGVRNLAFACLLLTMLVGLYFTLIRGVALLPIGILGLAIIVTYTQWINRRPLLCLFAPGIAFGPLMVFGTHFALTGYWSGLNLFVSLVPFFLTNNLLLLNQFPDIFADKQVGRLHFPISFGVKNSVIIYALFSFSTFLVLAIGLIIGLVSSFAYLAVLLILLQLSTVFGLSNCVSSINNNASEITMENVASEILPYMGINVAVAVLTPAITGLSIIF